MRITAQLIRSSDGIHLWSKQYDGDLSDVFKLQDQIARAIADELQLVLEGGQKSRLVAEATRNPEAYRLYLRASELLHKRDYARAKEAVAWLEQAIALDPQFVRAQSQLALVQMVVNIRDPKHAAEAERHARAAMATDPTLAQPVYVLGLTERYARRFAESRPYLEQAVKMAPRDASAHMYLAQWFIVTGYTKAGIEALDRAIALDPMLPNAVNWRAYQYLYAGDMENAEALFLRTDSLGLTLAKFGLGELQARHGNFAEARRLLAIGPKSNPASCGGTGPDQYDALYAGVVGGDEAAQAHALRLMNACLDSNPAEVPGWLLPALLRMKQYALAIDTLANRPNADDSGFAFRVWSPDGAPIRKLPQFNEAANRIGWVDAWEKYGAPDVCTRIAPRQYRCE